MAELWSESDIPAAFWDEVHPRLYREEGWKLIPWRFAREAAGRYGIAPLDVEAALLQAGIAPSRYLRNLNAFGLQGQLRLLKSTVCIVGCGGLGGRVAEILIRAGLGALVLVDHDVFADNNLNRQTACTEDTLGHHKCEAVKTFLQTINGAAQITACPVMMQEDNARSLLQGCDLAVDALDSQVSRVILLQAASMEGISLVHGGVENQQGQITCIPPKSGQYSLLREALSSEPVPVPFSSPGATVALAAALQAAEAIRILTKSPGPLDTGILAFDLTDMVFEYSRFCP